MPPRRLIAVTEKLRAGYLQESLDELRRVYDPKIPADRVLMAELLIETDGPEQIRPLVRQLVDHPAANPSIRSRACAILGVALRRENRLAEATRLLERAVHFASNSGEANLLCRAQLLLLVVKFDLFGPASLGTLPADVWRSAMLTGDAFLLAEIHCRVAALEGQRGAFDLCRRHLDLGMHHLERAENPYVEALICQNSCTLSAVAADPLAALGYAERALHLSVRSGDRFTRISAVNNLCHVSIMLGRISDAERYLATAEGLVRNEPFLKMCLYESRAQIQLLSGRLDECETTLSALTPLYDDADLSKRSYTAIATTTTHIQLLRKQGRFDKAVDVARTAAITSLERRLPSLEVIFNIHCADALVDLGRIEEAARTIGQAARILSLLGSDSLTVRAELERVRARVLAKRGELGAARGRFDLAITMHQATGQSIARDEAVSCRDDAIHEVGLASSRELRLQESMQREDGSGLVLGFSEIELAGILLSTASRPDLLGTVAFDLLTARVATRVALLARDATSVEVARHRDWGNAAEEGGAGEGVISIGLGMHQGKAFQLLIDPATDISGASRLAALETIIRAAAAKEEARRERLQRTSVWPRENEAGVEGPLFGSQRMRDVYREAMRASGSEVTILLTGETGVGKEILAREIHRLSRRAQRDFRPVVCAGIASGVLESQLFGYRKGSFTGAVSDFSGVIRGARGGTLFLDEIGELTPDLQVKLLRFLDSKEVHPLGELEPSVVDVRIIAATNADVPRLVEERKFREDLFYRLSVATFNIPPLRERREEIPSLVEHFLSKYSQQNHKPVPKVSDEALEHLLLYRWPGNVRQLRNEMERLAGMMDPGSTIRPGDLQPEIRSARRTQPTVPGPNELIVRLDQPMIQATESLEREMIKRALNGHKGNLDDAARALGITRKGLYHKRQRFGML